MPIQRINYSHFLHRNKLSVSHALHPLFEAIENAFNAIEERRNPDGLVRIIIHRSNLQQTLIDPETHLRSGTPSVIQGFDIVDNGIGFTEKNWRAFETLYTPHKAQTGGKGIGRLSYLQAFEQAAVESHYIDGSQQLVRSFLMEPTETITAGGETKPSSEGSNRTTVSLKSMHKELAANCPKALDAIARRIVGHFFRRFSSPSGIKCEIEDDWNGERIDLREFCVNELFIESKSEPIEIREEVFQVTHVRCKTSKASSVQSHQALLCGNGRVVVSRSLPMEFATAKRALELDGERFFYLAYVESPLLDASVQLDRLSFEIPEQDDDDGLFAAESKSAHSIQAIVEAVSRLAREFLRASLAPMEEKHNERVVSFCKKNVIYRPLLKHCEKDLHSIPIGISDEDLEQAVSRIYFEWKSKLRKAFELMAKSIRENAASLTEMKLQYSEMLHKLSELAYHELAAYVVERKAVVDFLWDRLSEHNGKFRDEDAIHDIFFPRKTTSDDQPWDQSNLWLIDERLMYQQFVASDLPFKKHGQLSGGSNKRPDIASYYNQIFDTTFAFAEGDSPFTSVTLVEFKRPERSHYTDDDNPVEQVAKYIREIRFGKARTNGQHVFRIRPDSPIHVHVICHLVDELEPYLLTIQHIKSSDGQGVIYHLPLANAIVQFTTFEKIIADARKRNEIFFEKLGINNSAIA